jgi:hypothetical protein
MTVAMQINHRYTLLGGVKQLQRRRLPTRARLASDPKRSLSTTPCSKKEIIITPSRRLNTLRQSYSRRGVPSIVSPPRRDTTGNTLNDVEPNARVEKDSGVLQVSLAGAKRSYAQLDVPSDVEYESDSSDSCASLASSSSSSSSSSSQINHSYEYRRYVKAARRRVRTVQFATLCSVVEIPHYCEYNARQKMQLWNGSKKIRMMAKRNSAEFLYDGWNIETASEEDEFVMVDGKSVHPVYATVAESTDAV